MWGGYCVYILFCAISCEPPPIPGVTWNTHTFNVKDLCYLQDTCKHAACAHVCGYTSGEQRENQMSTSETELSGGGEGEPGQLPARAASRQCAFLKTLGQAGLGEWLFKTLGSFYFTTREVNSTLKCQSKWSHLVSAGRSLHFSRSQTGRKS